MFFHNEKMFSSSGNGSSSDHVKGNSISDSDHMGYSNIFVFHAFDDFDDLFRVSDTAVSQYNYISEVILHDFVLLNDVQ